MAILPFGLIPDSWKTLTTQGPVPRHQMLAGINQAVFSRQWGMPQASLTLSDLQVFFLEQIPSLRLDKTESNNPIVGWIYEKKDALLVFRSKKLVSHFKWSEFKQKMKRQEAKVSYKYPIGVSMSSWQQ